MSERDEVALGCRSLEVGGLGAMVWGHVSLRDGSGGGTWLKAAGLGLEEIGPDDVILIDRRGTRLSGEGGVHLEYPIHTEILAARPDVNSVVHCHPRHAIAFATTGAELLAMSHEGTLFVPPAIARFDLTGDLIHTAELGVALAECLGERNAALMVNHGIVAVGSDVGEAVMTAILLEQACELQLMAMAAGGAKFVSSEEEALAKRARCWAPSQMGAGWNYLVRRVRKT